MERELILTPEELYYLGRILQAKYIDYAYVAAMNDIKQNFTLFEQEAKATLVSAGVLAEDFSGNVTIDQNALKILRPIFFGEVESSVDICCLGESNSVGVNKFHFYDGVATKVTGENGKLILATIDQVGIKEFVTKLLAESYDSVRTVVEDIDQTRITRFMAVKNILVGKTAIVKIYIESDGVIYEETESRIESVTKNDFITDVYHIVKGV